MQPTGRVVAGQAEESTAAEHSATWVVSAKSRNKRPPRIPIRPSIVTDFLARQMYADEESDGSTGEFRRNPADSRIMLKSQA